MAEVYLGLGANIEDPQKIIMHVARILQNNANVRKFQISELYNTSPVGGVHQSDFVNAVCCFETAMPILDLKAWLQEIEKQFGKTVIEKNGPRVIDIDLLLYGDLYLKTEDLEVPHPRMMDRLFVLVPLHDLTDTITIPAQTDDFDSGVSIVLEEKIRELRSHSGDRVEKISLRICS